MKCVGKLGFFKSTDHMREDVLLVNVMFQNKDPEIKKKKKMKKFSTQISD